MRDLTFRVLKQVLEKEGDFSNLVPGTSGYLKAVFSFSKEWDGCVKVASFFDRKGNEYARLIENGFCMIPDEVLADRIFRVQVTGAKQKQNFRLTTNKLKVIQGG